MSTAMVQDLLDQFRRTFGMLTETIQRFDDDQWRKGPNTMHHHGALTLLSVYHGNKGGSWK